MTGACLHHVRVKTAFAMLHITHAHSQSVMFAAAFAALQEQLQLTT